MALFRTPIPNKNTQTRQSRGTGMRRNRITSHSVAAPHTNRCAVAHRNGISRKATVTARKTALQTAASAKSSIQARRLRCF